MAFTPQKARKGVSPEDPHVFALTVWAVFHRPVPAHRRRRARLFARVEAGEEEAGVTFTGLERVFLLRPIAPDGDGRAGAGQPGVNGGNGGDATSAHVQSPVFAFLTQFKGGVPLRACVAPARRWEVFSFVPRATVMATGRPASWLRVVVEAARRVDTGLRSS